MPRSHRLPLATAALAGVLLACGSSGGGTNPPPSDTTAPVISAVAATQLLQTSAAVGWTTDEPATSRVEYGITPALGTLGALDPALVTGHAVALSGLQPATTYHYRVRSADGAGNEALGTPATFRTADPPPPSPTLVQHVSSTSNAPGKTEAGNHFRFTLPNPVLPGNCLVLGVAYAASGALAAVPVTDTNGTWPTSPAAEVLDANGNVNLAIFVLPDAPPGVHTLTLHFAAPLLPVQYTVSEFSGIATADPVSGSAGASAVRAPAIDSGTFTPSDNDAGGGNLVWSLFWDDENPGSGNEVRRFTAGNGFTLLDADIGWHLDASVHHASQYAVQRTAGPITPSMDVAMSPAHDRFVGLSVALRAAPAGTAPTGMRIVRILHFTNETFGAGPLTLQAPSSGNLLVLVTHDDPVVTIGGVTDDHSNGWIEVQPGTDQPQMWVAPHAATASSLLLTLDITGTPQPSSFTVYDIAGAASAPVGATAGRPVVGVSNLSSIDDFPALTPSAPDGIAIAACVLGQGPATGFAPGAPPGAIFDFVNYAGQTDGSTMNNSDCRGHVRTTSTATLHWNWTITPIPDNQGSATAVHFLAP